MLTRDRSCVSLLARSALSLTHAVSPTPNNRLTGATRALLAECEEMMEAKVQEKVNDLIWKEKKEIVGLSVGRSVCALRRVAG